MGDFWIQVATHSHTDLLTLNKDFRPKAVREDLRGYENLIARGQDGRSLRDDAAVLAMELGDAATAAAHFGRSVTLEPSSPSAHFNYGTALALATRIDRAVESFAAAVLLDPAYVIALVSLGRALVALDRPAEAVPRFEQAIRLRPSAADGYYGLALARRAMGERSKAIESLREAVRLAPQRTEPMMDLAWLLATGEDRTGRDHSEAISLAEKVLSLGPRTPVTLDVLAVALAAAGQFGRAIAFTEEALTGPLEPAFALELRGRLEGYRNGRPYNP
jgi:tetratricopeptide (TPR) repeat protein